MCLHVGLSYITSLVSSTILHMHYPFVHLGIGWGGDARLYDVLMESLYYPCPCSHASSVKVDWHWKH